MASYLYYYNELRPHQSLDNRPLSGNWSTEDKPLADNNQIACHEKLGGLLRHYGWVAALASRLFTITGRHLLVAAQSTKNSVSLCSLES